MKLAGLLCAAALFLFPTTVRAGNHWTAARIKARFKHEPSLRSLQKASLRFFMVNPKRVLSLRRRAANKAWLPTVKAGFSGDFMKFTRALEIAQYRAAYTFPWEEENQIDTRYQVSVSATWNLPMLIFNAEELDVTSLVGIQDGVLKEVTRLYFIRRRLQITLLLNPPKDVMTKVMLDLRLQELSGLLDAMTNGYLSRALRKAKRRLARNKRGRTRRRVVQKPPTPRVFLRRAYFLKAFTPVAHQRNTRTPSIHMRNTHAPKVPKTRTLTIR